MVSPAEESGSRVPGVVPLRRVKDRGESRGEGVLPFSTLLHKVDSRHRTPTPHVEPDSARPVEPREDHEGKSKKDMSEYWVG